MTALENSLATVDQRETEDRALRLLQRPELQKARAMARMLWEQGTAYIWQDQMSRFDNMIDEYLFHFAIRAANADPAYPKTIRFMPPPHHWFGRDVPGSRWGGDSADFVYRTIPIAHGGRYEIHGKAAGGVPPLCTYTLIGDSTVMPMTQTILDSLDMEFEKNGDFVITVDSTPANGRKNHIQTKPGADHFMVRDATADWIGQTWNALTVKRLDPDRDPLSDEQLAQRAAKHTLETFYYTYFTSQSTAGQPPNKLRVPGSAAHFGGMPTQMGCKGQVVLEEDEALIVNTNAAGARFRNITLTDAFHMSVNYWSKTSSFNKLQMAPDEDGRFTFVVAHTDPGIQNWLDTDGLRRCTLGNRWQAFGADGPTEQPTISTRVVKFKDLKKELGGVQHIDAAGRKQQIALREQGFRRRFVDK